MLWASPSRRVPYATVLAWLLGVALVFGLPNAPSAPAAPILITHWANSHMDRETLLPRFAEQFNQAGQRTGSGRPIVVQVFGEGSAETVDELVSRATRGVPLDPKLPDPTLVTPSADHWLTLANHAAGRPVVDLARTQSIARAWIGIATYREMAECLGWPQKELGFADIVALRADPLGWARYPCAKAEWGQRPLLAFTDPDTSSTGRSVLFTLYAIAAGKPPDQLTVADVTSPGVVSYVKQFQRAVDHYVIGTIPLNTQIYQGPRYGHFFFIPEDNLVQLYQGTEGIQFGVEIKREPITRPMVMIYPKEGSTAHNHSAGLVQASWVTPEQVEAAQKWVGFLQEDEQQRAFMAEGFRPATKLPVGEPISGRYGLDPTKPTAAVNPERMDPAAAVAILQSWEDVKKPSVVTFVVDSSVSMQGAKLTRVKEGLTRALDGLAKQNQLGFVAFADTVLAQVPVAPLPENRFAIKDAVDQMQAQGSSALYDGIKAGIELADAASGDPDTTRAVVVLSDGRANRGRTELHDLLKMTSLDEVAIREFRGFVGDEEAVDEQGRRVPKKEVLGTGLIQPTRHPILIFFVGVGDADMEIGRILAGATGAGSQIATEQELPSVLESFGKYF